MLHRYRRCAAAVENLLYCLLTLDDVLQLGPPETPAEAIENTERLSLGRDYQRAMAAQRADAKAQLGRNKQLYGNEGQYNPAQEKAKRKRMKKDKEIAKNLEQDEGDGSDFDWSEDEDVEM